MSSENIRKPEYVAPLVTEIAIPVRGPLCSSQYGGGTEGIGGGSSYGNGDFD